MSLTSPKDLRATLPERLASADVGTRLIAWILCVAAIFATVLLVRGTLSPAGLVSLALLASPALFALGRRPTATSRALHLAVWALAAAAAAWFAGGLSTPLALMCLTPALGALILEAPLAEGIAAAVGSASLLAIGAVVIPPPTDAASGETNLTAFLLLLLCAGAAGIGLSTSRPILATPKAGAGELLPAPTSAAPETSPELEKKLRDAEAARQDAEAGRARAEADAAARAMFLANMSHELRTPLNAIMGFSDMMRARMFGPLAAKYGEYADLIHESGEHLLDLINDILDMSKIEADRYALHPETFDARAPVNAAARLMQVQADNGGVHLRCILPDAPLMVTADLRAFKQITLNLLSNAVKFTPPAGSVILHLAAASGKLELVVADTGIGIAPEDLKRLGRPFEQAGGARDRARGSGLGLALVAALARLHGGELTLESRVGEGTAATVRLPALAETDADLGPGGEEPRPASPSSSDDVQRAFEGAAAPSPTSPSAPSTGEASLHDRSTAKIVSLAAARLSPPPPRNDR